MEEYKKISGIVPIDESVTELAKKEIKDIVGFKKAIEENLDRKVSELMEIILAGGFFLDSSDIHIEPEEKQGKIRVRVDGVLFDVLSVNLDIYNNLVSRIKLLSKLKLNISNRPQDGRFSVLMDKSPVEIRTSSVPAEFGESLVLRILNPKWAVNMSELGLRKDLEDILKKEIKKPNGIILCAGPTGAGKTTTLYSFLKEIANPEIKVITIEDPIEYHLDGISQTSVDEQKGYSFANGLKAIVRQDPDVILIGEIRDKETAKISLQAALTGHLVLSTVHTNNSSGAIARLESLGEVPQNISPALNVILGQQFVRKICPECKTMTKPTSEEIKLIKKELIKIPHKITKIAKPKGCKACNSTGYKGRIGIFELLIADDEMKKFILTSPSIVDIKEKAMKKGMILMRQDGFLKVLEGITSIEEIERVTTE